MCENEQDVVAASKERSAGGHGTGADGEREGFPWRAGRSLGTRWKTWVPLEGAQRHVRDGRPRSPPGCRVDKNCSSDLRSRRGKRGAQGAGCPPGAKVVI